MGLIGLMGLAGCSGEHVEEPEAAGDDTEQVAKTTPIAFSTDLPEQQKVTRSEPLETYATEFKVWGYKNMSESAGSYGNRETVFPGYTVSWEANTAATTASNTHDWEYVVGSQTIKYWDWSAKAYRFFGATSYEGEDTGGPYTENKTYGTYKTYATYDAYEVTMSVDATAPDGAPYYSKMWFSTGELPTYSDKQFGKPVTLEFVKPFARVRFKFTYVYPREGIILTGKSFKPTDGSKIVRRGSLTIGFPLDGTATKESLVSAAADGTDAKTLDAFTEDWDPEDDSKVYTETDEGWYTVLPNNTQGSYTLNVNINGTPRTAVVPANYMTWLPGYQYTYVFKITEEGGVEIDLVASAFNAWTDLVTTREVYNW